MDELKPDRREVVCSLPEQVRDEGRGGKAQKGFGSDEKPEAQEGWAAEDPEEVCCHSDQCGLFFFWLPLLHEHHVLGSGNHNNPTTPVSHIAEKESKREKARPTRGRESGTIKTRNGGSKFVLFWCLHFYFNMFVNVQEPSNLRDFVCAFAVLTLIKNQSSFCKYINPESTGYYFSALNKILGEIKYLAFYSSLPAACFPDCFPTCCLCLVTFKCIAVGGGN